MQKISKKRGITLVSLIITIIILMILASVVINMTLGNNGIFNKAKTAIGQYQNAQDYEETTIAKYSNEINSYVEGNRNNEKEINTLISNKLNEMFFPNKTQTITLSNNKATIQKNGWLYIEFVKASQGDFWYAYKNGNKVLSASSPITNCTNSVYLPVKTGDVITVTNQSYFSLRLDYYEAE